MTADQLLEGRDLACPRIAEAVHEQIRGVWEAIGAAQVCGSVGTEPGQWILSLHPVIGQIALTSSPNNHRSVRLGAHHHKADPFVLHHAVQQARIHGFDLLVDLITVGDRTDGDGKALAAKLARKQITPSHARDYARIIKDLSSRRLLRNVGANILEMAEDRETPMDTILGKAQQAVLRVNRDTASLMTHVGPVVAQIRSRMGREGPGGPSTGIADWDRLTGGLEPTKLSIIAGRPGMGKSALLAQMARHLAVEEGLAVVIFYMESGAAQLVQRMIQGMTGLTKQQLRTGDMPQKDLDALNETMIRLAAAPLYIDESKNLTLHAMLSRARLIGSQVPPALVAVDYVQLLLRSTDNRVAELANISRALATASGADDLNCHVLAVSQLNRQVEKRQDKRPRLHDLRDSGALEQDASLVTFVYRPWVYREPGKAERKKYRDGLEPAQLILKKNRDGETGTARVLFQRRTVAFHNMERRANDQGIQHT